MKVDLKSKSGPFNILMNAVSVTLSVGTMIYGVLNLGLSETWPELVLNMLYISCLVLLWMYYVKHRISFKQYSYWCTIFVGVAVLLRDILFAPPLKFFFFHIVCMFLSVMLLVMLTYFYARREWKSYSKFTLWMICVIDMLIAALYMIAIYLEPVNEYTSYLLTEIWIRPTITYGLVICFMAEAEKENQTI